MKRGLASIFVSIVVALAAVPAFAGFASSDLYLTSIGRVAGADGAQFYTTVWVTNLSSTQPVSFGFFFLASGQANPNPASFADTLAPGETKMYEDVMLTKFGLTSALGAGHIVSSSGEVFVSSRIFNLAAGKDLGASTGLFFAGVPSVFARSAGRILHHSGSQSGRQRKLPLQLRDGGDHGQPGHFPRRAFSTPSATRSARRTIRSAASSTSRRTSPTSFPTSRRRTRVSWAPSSRAPPRRSASAASAAA